ncbi:MAG: spondin domain-containing protein [Armatimonadetes bacterium]|nr:spondin domain-containing protein [Armatimonadota bacterium]
MIRRGLIAAAAALALVAGMGQIASAQGGVNFLVVINNLGPQPLSPIFLATGNSGYDIFTLGQPASPALQAIAESGDVAPLQADAAAAQTAGNVADHQVVHPGSPLPAGQSAFTFIVADPAHPWLSLVSMLGLSNDAFVGFSYGATDRGVNLFPNGTPLNAHFTLSFLDAWDAGTEVNDELSANLVAYGGNGHVAENGVVTGPHPGLTGNGAIPLSANWYGRDIARVTIIPTVIPEPATMTVLGMGLASLLIRKRSR